MEVREVSEKEYEDFLQNVFHTPNHSLGMFNRIKIGNHKPKLFGGFENGQMVIAALAGFYRWKKFFQYMYMPYGYTAKDPSDIKTVQAFFEGIARMYKNSNVLAIRLEPMIELQELDLFGNPKEGGYDNRSFRTKMEEAGFVVNELTFENKLIGQPRQVSIIDLVDYEPGSYKGFYDCATKVERHHTIESQLKKMDTQTRNKTKQSLKPYIKIRETDIDTLMNIGNKSAHDKGFEFCSRETLAALQEGFKDNCKIKLAYLDVDAYLQDSQERIQKASEILKQDEGKTNKKALRRIADAKEETEQAQKHLEQAREYESLNLKEIELAASMFLYTPYTTFYMFSGMDRDYHQFRGSNRLLYDTMEESIQKGAHQFNLLGISGTYQKDDPGYSLVAYKRGLGGRIAEYAGTMYYPINGLLAKTLISSLPE